MPDPLTLQELHHARNRLSAAQEGVHSAQVVLADAVAEQARCLEEVAEAERLHGLWLQYQ